MSNPTRPQYVYRPTVEGDFIILSVVYGSATDPGIGHLKPFENYVAHCETEEQTIALIDRLRGMDIRNEPVSAAPVVGAVPWVDKRPANCRNRQRDEGKAYPKSGCESCKNGGLMGCPHEKKEPRTSNDVR